jgi:dienelactone hydrolase
MADDDLHDFQRETFTFDGKTRDIFRLGTGPAVIVIAEMPGITPKVAEFARRVAGRGMTAVMPHLFGDPGRDPSPDAHSRFSTVSYGLSSMAPACVSKEFATWATGRTSPVIGWLRALANEEHRRCGGPGVGAVGMCFTGGYALAMAADPVILAPVLSQPSMPMPITKKQKASIDISDEDLAVVKDRCAHEDLTVMGLRFTSDRFVPAERFQFLREQLGDAFVAVELDDMDANPEAIMRPHSVLTEHLIDQPGTKTRQTLDAVLDLFTTKLQVA